MKLNIMSRYGNYKANIDRNPYLNEENTYKDWDLQFKINDLSKKNKNINQSINIITLCYGILFIFMFYHLADNVNRLNEHKRLLIAQQTQINQLILNAEYNERK